MSSNQKLRVMDVFDRTVRSYGPKPALRVKRQGFWQTITWGDYHKQVRQVARALMSLGIQPGAGVAIIGYNSPEWFFADIGAIYAGAVPAGIYTTSSPEQCEYIAAHCAAEVVFVDDKEQLAKFLAIRSRLPALKALVLMHGESNDTTVHSWTRFLQLGLNTTEQDLDLRVASQSADAMRSEEHTSE